MINKPLFFTIFFFIMLFASATFLEIGVAAAEDKIPGLYPERTQAVLKCLKEKDWKSLADFVHPTEGVKFSPYAYVDEDAVTLSAKEIKDLEQTKEKIYNFGAYDGSGDPMELTFSDYYNRFIFDKDFTKAPEIGVGKIVHRSNTANNIDEIFGPEAKFIEFYCPSSSDDNIDWASLRLVFRQDKDTWYLVGIVHDCWTT